MRYGAVSGLGDIFFSFWNKGFFLGNVENVEIKIIKIHFLNSKLNK